MFESDSARKERGELLHDMQTWDKKTYAGLVNRAIEPRKCDGSSHNAQVAQPFPQRKSEKKIYLQHI